MYWNDTITIYSKTTDSGGAVTWKHRTYNGCFWKERTGKSPNGGSVASTATRLARIPCGAEVSVGDIAVYGSVSDVIDEYTAGSRSSDFRKKHPKSFVISSVHDNAMTFYPLPHMYIEGA